MFASWLDRLLSLRSHEGWVCPKCRYGMRYQPMFSSGEYVCNNCRWMQRATPERGKIEE